METNSPATSAARLEACGDAELDALFNLALGGRGLVYPFIEHGASAVLNAVEREGMVWGRERDGTVWAEGRGWQVFTRHRNFVRALLIVAIVWLNSRGASEKM